MRVIFMLLIINSAIFCTTIEDGWKGIKPLVTDKTTVNALLGKPLIDDNDYHKYSTEDGGFNVNYSVNPCESNSYDRGEFNVPKDTVLTYYITLKKKLKLSDLEFKREKYRRVKDHHFSNEVAYYNNDDGVEIQVHISDNVEYIDRIYFRPSKKDKESFACSNLKSKNTAATTTAAITGKCQVLGTGI